MTIGGRGTFLAGQYSRRLTSRDVMAGRGYSSPVAGVYQRVRQTPRLGIEIGSWSLHPACPLSSNQWAGKESAGGGTTTIVKYT